MSTNNPSCVVNNSDFVEGVLASTGIGSNIGIGLPPPGFTSEDTSILTHPCNSLSGLGFGHLNASSSDENVLGYSHWTSCVNEINLPSLSDSCCAPGGLDSDAAPQLPDGFNLLPDYDEDEVNEQEQDNQTKDILRPHVSAIAAHNRIHSSEIARLEGSTPRCNPRSDTIIPNGPDAVDDGSALTLKFRGLSFIDQSHANQIWAPLSVRTMAAGHELCGVSHLSGVSDSHDRLPSDNISATSVLLGRIGSFQSPVAVVNQSSARSSIQDNKLVSVPGYPTTPHHLDFLSIWSSPTVSSQSGGCAHGCGSDCTSDLDSGTNPDSHRSKEHSDTNNGQWVQHLGLLPNDTRSDVVEDGIDNCSSTGKGNTSCGLDISVDCEEVNGKDLVSNPGFCSLYPEWSSGASTGFLVSSYDFLMKFLTWI
ncbi:unnamed protein product [Protopolystoma xenopodis]|uniref:Uncharacterized protein n=1 Tax=Protopolystoma xenopodis TaxID=117903 RepID=A0A3S4ZKS3_9PLAT|nr:unnamed protein product [Protopolystoma xenopodis]